MQRSLKLGCLMSVSLHFAWRLGSIVCELALQEPTPAHCTHTKEELLWHKFTQSNLQIALGLEGGSWWSQVYTHFPSLNAA